MAFEKDERTEAPTPKKRKETRDKGQVARSGEVNSAMGMIMSFVYFLIMGPQMGARIKALVADILNKAASTEVDMAGLQNIYGRMLGNTAAIVLPFFIYIMAVGLVVNLAQVGWKWTMKPMKPKFNKFNVFTGIKKVFISKDSMVKLLFSSAKVVVILWILYISIQPRVGELVRLSDQSSLLLAIMLMIKIISTVLIRICIFYALLAAVDYAYQKYKFEEGIKMTKQEVQDEQKSADLDPKYKAKIRARQMQLSRSRMMSAVPQANVVITNPTTFAVAIKYDMENMDSPIVVAKGARLIAQRIKEIAIANDIPIIENKPLARDLYKNVPIDAPIPLRLYKAVAQILAYVYNLKRTARA